MKPMIGISMSRDYAYQGYARDFVRATYINAIVSAGGIPVLLANVDESQELLRQCDGLLLTGGGDIDPGCFGAQDAGTDWTGVSPERDQSELRFIDMANHLDMPIFGICRGVQALAVGFGGSLIQDIPSAHETPLQHSQPEKREMRTHGVNVVRESRVGELVLEPTFEVNSFHHQAIDRMPDGWRVVAHAEDGIIEAMEYPGDRFLIGVQWHPEDLVAAEGPDQRLFKGFVEASLAYRARRGHYVGNSH